jgi:hypothetical protein
MRSWKLATGQSSGVAERTRSSQSGPLDLRAWGLTPLLCPVARILRSACQVNVNARSHSSSPLLRAVLFGPPRRGTVVARQALEFSGYVVTLTLVGSARMPNGIECGVRVHRSDSVVIGGGNLVISDQVIAAGPAWNPVPVQLTGAKLPPGPEPVFSELGGMGLGLTAGGDDVLSGYIAGLVLLHGMHARASRLAEAAAARTNPLSATLLRHAALGEVPEVVHVLLATGDSRPLLSFRRSSGQAWLRGLVSAGYILDVYRLPAARLRAAGDG